MMKHKSDTDIDLELAAFFEAAKEVDPMPNAGFLEAIAADAQTETDARATGKPVTEASSTPWLITAFRSIGGWQSITALTTCACFGIYAGYSTPENLDYLNSTQSIVDATAMDANDDGSFSIASDIEALFLEV
jgi:hypothetical protein